MSDIDVEIGIAITLREGKIMEGMPKEQAWAEYMEELEKIQSSASTVKGGESE